jgi:hypothetical protein
MRGVPRYRRYAPKRRNPKSEVVQVRLTPEEKLLVEEVAAAAGGNKSSWIYGLMMRELAQAAELELAEEELVEEERPPKLTLVDPRRRP